jgi:hypothetical protein
MSPSWLAGIGALLSGSGSVIGAIVGLHLERRRARNECEQRIKDIRQAWREGMKLQRRDDEPGKEEDERWSHLP